MRRARRTISAISQPKNVVDRLRDLTMADDNPGDLRARIYLPSSLEPSAPLVVVLHGCTQSAAVYDHGSGWSQLADRHGFALLFPEQQRANNMNLCFNWYQPEDARRGGGEAGSIRAMIGRMGDLHGVDPRRVYITGLSAGGAMTSVMLAAYPETFAAGAIIAGLPYGAADTLGEALGAMSSPGQASDAALGQAVRAASSHRGPWPRVSVWHGGADRLVVPENGKAIVRQWRDLHGLPARPSLVETVDGYPRRVWTDSVRHGAGRGLCGDGHGAWHAAQPGAGEGQSGEAGAHMLDVGLSSTDRIAAFFGIAPEPAARSRSLLSPQAEQPAPSARE